MWALQYIPDNVIHLALVIGLAGILAGFVLGVIPLIGKYQLPIQIISIIVFAASLYLEGGIANEAKWKLKIAELEAKVAKAEAKSPVVNTQIVTKVLTKKQVIKQKGDDIITYVDREVVKYDATCPIPESVITAHNAAASSKEFVTPKTVIDTAAHNDAAKPMILPKK